MTVRDLVGRTLRLAVPLYLVSIAVSLVGTALAILGLMLAAGNRTWLANLLGPNWLNTLLEAIFSLGVAAPEDRVRMTLLLIGAFIGAPLLVVLQWLGYTFVSGGIVDRLLAAGAPNEASPPFWRTCRRWFWPFFGLGVLGLIFSGVLASLGGLGAYYLSGVVGSTAAFLLFGAWVAVLLGWLEVARAAMVWHGSADARPALRRALELIARPGPLLLWIFLALPGVGLLLVSMSLPPAADPPALSTALLTVALGQVYAFLGAWLKVIRLAAACKLVVRAKRG